MIFYNLNFIFIFIFYYYGYYFDYYYFLLKKICTKIVNILRLKKNLMFLNKT